MRELTKHKAYTAMVYATLASDHQTPATGKTLLFTLSKAGAAFAASTPTITERGNGWYSLAFAVGDFDTEGDWALRGYTAASDIDEIALVGQVKVRPDNKSAAVVADGSNSATTFKTDLTDSVNETWTYCFLVFITGTLAGQVRKVTAYNGTTKFVTVDAFTATPTDGDKFALVNS